jgi:hypothetical protein
MIEKKIYQKSGFLLTAGILMILFIAGFFAWRHYKYKLVNKKLDALVTVKSKGLYALSYKNLVINEALGDVSAENVELIPDSSVYQEMVKNKTDPDNLFFIKIPKLLITGVKTPKALLNKEIIAHIIRIQDPEITIRIVRQDDSKKSNFSKYLKSEMYQQLLGNLKKMSADSVVVENANLTLTGREPANIRFRAGGLSLRLSGTAIDSVLQNDSSRILYSKELVIHCNQLDLPLQSKIYTLRVGGLDFNTQTNSLHAKDVRFKPLLSETDFARTHKYATDRLDLVIGSLDIRRLNRNAFLHEQLIADSLLLSGASFHDFRDKSYPQDSVDRTDAYPQNAIMQLPLQIYLKNILIRDSYIEYKEKNDKSDSSGKVSFFHVQATFHNVTNMIAYIRKDDLMRLDFKALFLNKASFTAVINMKLNDPVGHFKLHATMGDLDAVSLNPLLKPMSLAELEKGKIDSLNFHLDATNRLGNGRLYLTYNDLSLKLLKKDDAKNKYKTRFLPTLAAGIAIKDSNPKNGNTRIGQVHYTRDLHRAIFNLMWKSLFSGIKKIAL